MSSVMRRSVHRCFEGTVIYCEHASREIGGMMRFAVFLPPQAAAKPVPALLYLAGLTCTEETFMIKAGALGAAAKLGLAVVTPDTSPRDRRYPGDDDSWDFGQGAGFYVDATAAPWREGYRMYSYVSNELPELIEREFPVNPGRWGVFGHSMGGHGALVVGLRNPGRFRSISAFAPICAPISCPWGIKAFSNYLGPDRQAWRTYDAADLIRGGMKASDILVDQGLGDQFLADQLNPHELEKACAEVGQPLTMRRHAGYDHSYFFIQTFIEAHLAHHRNALA